MLPRIKEEITYAWNKIDRYHQKLYPDTRHCLQLISTPTKLIFMFSTSHNLTLIFSQPLAKTLFGRGLEYQSSRKSWVQNSISARVYLSRRWPTKNFIVSSKYKEWATDTFVMIYQYNIPMITFSFSWCYRNSYSRNYYFKSLILLLI